MCDCIEKAIETIEQNGYEDVEAPIELLSGKLYIEFSGRKNGKKKINKIPVLLSKCSFCGEEYQK